MGCSAVLVYLTSPLPLNPSTYPALVVFWADWKMSVWMPPMVLKPVKMRQKQLPSINTLNIFSVDCCIVTAVCYQLSHVDTENNNSILCFAHHVVTLAANPRMQ